MSRVRYCVVLPTALLTILTAGCAGNRENLAAAAGTPAAPPALAATPTMAAAQAPGSAPPLAAATAAPAAPAAPVTAATAAAEAPVEPAAASQEPRVVDGNQLAQRSADTLLCRDMLVRGSNAKRRMCGTAEQWKVYERREAQAAAEMVRRMQQGRPDGDDFRRRR
jgi:hypothetical protein